MFYAHLEGRKNFIARSIECGLRGATYNIVYPPDLDEAADTDFDILVNPQTFRLTFPAAARSPKVAHILSRYNQLAATDLATLDADGRAIELSELGRAICDNFLVAQEALNATDIIAPYYFASSVRDPLLDISILSSQYLDERTEKIVFTGIMMDSDILGPPADFEELADRLTSPDSPPNYYFDLNLNSSPKRPLRNATTLSILRLLFNSLGDADKYTLLARCNIEGLLLRSASDLDAFSSSYYQSERQALHNRLSEDYVAPPDQMRAPTPYLFAPELMTDIPRPLVQRLILEGYEELFTTCECGECSELVLDVELPHAAKRAPVHYSACMTWLDNMLAAEEDAEKRAGIMLDWIECAEEVVADLGRAAVPAGTFTHLPQWRSWIEDQMSAADDG